MQPIFKNRSVEFFDTQFQRQVARHEYALNPFEQAILPFVYGSVLDLGCGLGNLSIEAAQKGCSVTSLDASPTAVADLDRRAKELRLSIQTCEADLRELSIQEQFDSVICIGLLMFFPCENARKNIGRIKEFTKPAGIAAVNTLIEGTTFLDFFDENGYCLFGEKELSESFADWKLEYQSIDSFPAPHDTVKRFCTIVARKPTSA
jgi:tellurite methyltransferase